MKEKIVLTDVKSTYYKLVSPKEEVRDKRYRELADALLDAERKGAEVIKVVKRLKETIEFENVQTVKVP